MHTGVGRTSGSACQTITTSVASTAMRLSRCLMATRACLWIVHYPRACARCVHAGRRACVVYSDRGVSYSQARARRPTRLQQRAGDAIGAGRSRPVMRVHFLRVVAGDAKGAGGSRPFCRRTRRAVRPLPLPVWCFSRLHRLSSHA